MPRSTGEDWLGAPDLARLLGIDLRTVYRILDRGEIPAYKIGRVIRIQRADVDAYLERAKVRPGDLSHLYADWDRYEPPSRG